VNQLPLTPSIEGKRTKRGVGETSEKGGRIVQGGKGKHRGEHCPIFNFREKEEEKGGEKKKGGFLKRRKKKPKKKNSLPFPPRKKKKKRTML